MATNTSPVRTCRQSVVQLVTRIWGSRAPRRSRAPSSRSETPPAMVGRSVTRGLLACNVLGFFGKVSEAGDASGMRCQPRGQIVAEERQGVKASFERAMRFNLPGWQQLLYMRRRRIPVPASDVP